MKDFHNHRIFLLAKPKEPYIGWHTCVGPNVMWGTQAMIWPVSPQALKGSASQRTQVLATPKKDFKAGTVNQSRPQYFYSAGRSSVIWDVSDPAKQAEASDRLSELAQHKTGHPEFTNDRSQYVYSCGRESPIWTLSTATQNCGERPRTTTLANYRDYHPNYQGERQIQSIVSEAAKSTQPSERISNLASAKKRPEGPFREPLWPVSEQAKSVVATPRCAELARAKPLAEGFQLHREIEWPISKAARRAQASTRITALAQPVNRATMDHVQFNPYAFQVKESALTGQMPKRIADLYSIINR